MRTPLNFGPHAVLLAPALLLASCYSPFSVEDLSADTESNPDSSDLPPGSADASDTSDEASDSSDTSESEDTGPAEGVCGNGTVEPGDICFSSYTPINAASEDEAFSPRLGDLNDDGALDVVYSLASGALEVSVQDPQDQSLGSGSLVAPGSFTGASAHFLAVAAMNGDDNPDIVGMRAAGPMAEAEGPEVLLANDSTGFSGPMDSPTSPSFATAFAVGDLSGNGDPDVVVGGELFVGVYANDGTGTLTATTEIEETFRVSSVEFADMNSDGDLDLVYSIIGGGGNGGVRIVRGDGSDTLTGVTLVTDYDAGTNFARSGDFNGDGARDFVAIRSVSNTLTPVVQNSDESFTALDARVTETNPVGIAVANFDDDDYDDVVVLCTGTAAGVLQIFRGNADGSLEAPVDVPLAGFVGATTVTIDGDFNGDGVPDILIGPDRPGQNGASKQMRLQLSNP